MKIFLAFFLAIISFTISLSFSPYLFALGETDITKPSFTVDLSKLDPVGNNHNSQSSDIGASGKDAAITLLDSFAKILLFIIPILAGISFIIAGYYYVLSGGDSEKASQAKTIIKWNLIAIIIALFSYVLIYIVASLLGGDIK